MCVCVWSYASTRIKRFPWGILIECLLIEMVLSSCLMKIHSAAYGHGQQLPDKSGKWMVLWIKQRHPGRIVRQKKSVWRNRIGVSKFFILLVETILSIFFYWDLSVMVIAITSRLKFTNIAICFKGLPPYAKGIQRPARPIERTRLSGSPSIHALHPTDPFRSHVIIHLKWTGLGQVSGWVEFFAYLHVFF